MQLPLVAPGATALIVLSASLLLGCGGDGDGDQAPPPSNQPADSQKQTTQERPSKPSTEERADTYALKLSGGETTGCSTAAPGAEAEREPGCIYSVAFTGCYEGMTGKRLSPVPVEQEFPDEPKLQAIYHRAVSDCGGS